MEQVDVSVVKALHTRVAAILETQGVQDDEQLSSLCLGEDKTRFQILLLFLNLGYSSSSRKTLSDGTFVVSDVALGGTAHFCLENPKTRL